MSTSRHLKITLRIFGAALLAFGAFRMVVDVAASFEAEEHATSNGFVIHHSFAVAHVATIALLVAQFWSPSALCTQERARDHATI